MSESGIVFAAVTAVCTVMLGVVVKVLADDARTGIPKISAALIRRAARRLPPDLQDRYCEEWLAALNEMEERSVMLTHAIGCLVLAGPRIRAQARSTSSRTTAELLARAFPEMNAEKRKHYACMLLGVDGDTFDMWLSGAAVPDWQRRVMLRSLVICEDRLDAIFGPEHEETA